MYAPPGQTNIVSMDHAVAGWVEAGYSLMSRTDSQAYLVRRRSFPKWGYLFALLLGIGLVFFAGMYLVSKVPSVRLLADEDGNVLRVERKMSPLKRSSLLLGILCLASSSAVIAGVPIVVLGMAVNNQMVGVHVCTDINFSPSMHQCSDSAHRLTVDQVDSAHFTAGVSIVSGFRMNELTIDVTGHSAGTAFIRTEDGGSASLIYGDLTSIFRHAGLEVAPGNYEFAVHGGTADATRDIGTYALTIVP
jgi:hypothetical protein